jgi:hypothetical protein
VIRLSILATRTLLTAATLFASVAAASAQPEDKRSDVEFRCRPIFLDSSRDDSVRVIQGKDGWFFRAADDLRSKLRQDAFSLHKLKRLVDTLKARNVSIVFLPVPLRGIVARDKWLPEDEYFNLIDGRLLERRFKDAIDDFRSTGLTVVDYDLEALRKAGADELFFRRDIHWTNKGAQWFAERTAETIAQTLGTDRLKATPDPVSSTGAVAWDNNLLVQTIRKGCENDVPSEMLVTPESKAVAGSAADLLVDDSSKQIALTGSSFSRSSFGFEVYLSSMLNQTIANFQIDGGEYYASMISMLISDAFQSNSFDLIIWETQMTYDFAETYALLREMPASAAGRCEGEAVVASGRLAGAAAGTSVNIDSNARVTGEDFYIWLTTSDQNVDVVELLLTYENGDQERMRFDHSNRFTTKGRFARDLHEAIPAHLTKISLEAPANAEAEILVCRSPLAKGQS